MDKLQFKTMLFLLFLKAGREEVMEGLKMNEVKK